MPKRLALMGGSFNPIHPGHLAVLTYLTESGYFDAIEVVPCHNPTHKSPYQTSVSERLFGLKQALEGMDVTINPIELNRCEPSYAVTTLELIQKERPHHRLYWIAGDDSFETLPHWHQAHRLPSLCHMVVFPRVLAKLPTIEPWKEVKSFNDFSDRCYGQVCWVTNFERHGASSAQLRAATKITQA